MNYKYVILIRKTNIIFDNQHIIIKNYINNNCL